VTPALPRLAIIADDLTGGLDTGVAFAARGWRTRLRVAGVRREASGVSKDDRVQEPGTHASQLTPHACLIYDTETREADEETARRVVREVCAEPLVQAAPRLYKKIDSTLRGQWLAELREVWKARAARTTVLCPAFPAVGRALIDGEVRVNGRPLAEAGFAGSGRLRDLLLARWCGRVVSVAAAQLSSAPLADPDRAPWLLLPDAATDADLDLIVRRLVEADLDCLLCGAGGLAAAWARALIPDPAPLPPLVPTTGPIWVLAGSQHPATCAQMEALSSVPGAHVERFEASNPAALQRLRQMPDAPVIGLALQSKTADAAESHHSSLITHHAFAAWVEEFIAATAAVARARGVGAFVATGGETAALLLRALDTSSLEVDRELLPGIPLSRLGDGPMAGALLVTKAGGFGELGALVRSVTALRGEERAQTSG
jgi:D-threonate/D-erythronate kinase